MSNKKEILRWISIGLAFIALLAILWNTYSFFQMYKEEERFKMNIWAEASSTLDHAKFDTNLDLILLILTENRTIPIIQTTAKDSIISTTNIDDKIISDPKALDSFLKKLKSQNAPITVSVEQETQYLYYGDSSLLIRLKYYPLALVLIFIFFTTLIIVFYKSNKSASQNRLWTGMAKETAHQIGTPLTSLLGWLEIMKLENVDQYIIDEVDKDVKKLQIIADRFSKIGSKPQLTSLDIVGESKKIFEYIQQRNSKQIDFQIHLPPYPIYIPLNKELHSWTIENLLKNAIDAIKGKGKITLVIQESATTVNINITDSGSGIPKKLYNKIFEPGYTTKKRGWGLGLSLTKRIVKDFQNGKIKVLHSEIGKGTTFTVVYKKERPST